MCPRVWGVDQVKKWWGPEGVTTRGFVADVRVGGKYRWDLVNQEGEEMAAHGEYRELVPDKKVVFTWAWEGDEIWENRTSIVMIELSDRDGGTELRLIHEQLPSEASRDRHNDGWTSVLNRLQSVCEQ